MDPVPHTELIRNETVRAMVGNISRHTLIAWRREKDMPGPVDVDGLELWDRRAIKRWCKDNRETVRAAKRRKRPSA
jgi:hypothetical protein